MIQSLLTTVAAFACGAVLIRSAFDKLYCEHRAMYGFAAPHPEKLIAGTVCTVVGIGLSIRLYILFG